MNVKLAEAAPDDAMAIAELHNAVADHLTERFGRGHWSSQVSEKGVLFALRTSRVFVAKSGPELVGSFRLGTNKPWAIDKSYFTKCDRPLYLTAMAVAPSQQRKGIGRAMLDGAQRIVRAWPGDAIRLDAYDTAAGAGEFYAKCGFRETGRVTYRATPLVYYELLLQ